MIAEWLILIFLGIGLVFNTLGVIGLHRFPDVYTRMHAATKATTFGSVFTSFAVIAYAGATYLHTTDPQFITLGLHTVVAVLALALTNAVSSHALARAAHRSGIMPAPSVVDRLKEAGR